MKDLTKEIAQLLPQTQCRQCGFDGCAQYAKAIALDQAKINRCATGGEKTIRRLADLLKIKPIALDPEYGKEMPLALARINPERCIGCRICANVCPVCAITGLPKHLFAVIEGQCTGCALCIRACPVDAIELFEPGRAWTEKDAQKAKAAYEASCARHQKEKAEEVKRLEKAALNKSELLKSVMARVKEKSAIHE